MTELPPGYRVVYKHERVPRFIMEYRAQKGVTGPPREFDLYLYTRGEGFNNLSVEDRPYERGGRTVALIYNRDNELVATGVAECSYSDNFIYKLGRQIAFGRAVQHLPKSVTGPLSGRKLIQRELERVLGGGG